VYAGAHQGGFAPLLGVCAGLMERFFEVTGPNRFIPSPALAGRYACVVWWAVCCITCALCGQRSQAGPVVPLTTEDPIGDVAVRRTDPGADGRLDLIAHWLPDIHSYTLGQWQPYMPQASRFDGVWDDEGEFFRLDVRFEGLANPPGTMGRNGYPWEPFKYGPSPVFGFIELNVDASFGTGGELEFPEYRYLGNVARWGGQPSVGGFVGRVASDDSAFDGDMATTPYVDRSGEEFHLSLIGQGKVDHDEIIRSDHTDWWFGPGETWIVPGWLLHRSHAYEPFSYAGPFASGDYEVYVKLRFRHNIPSNVTTMTLVYPLTNVGSMQMRGDAQIEDLDTDPTNQNSIQEALNELVLSVLYPWPDWPSDPDWVIISDWGNYGLWPDPNNVDQFLNPMGWRINIQMGGTYTEFEGQAAFAWSDVWPNVVAGDFNGSGEIDQEDLALFYHFLTTSDGEPELDADGTVNDEVLIFDFGPGFNIHDIDYNGLVDMSDYPVLPTVSVPADFDQDWDVDQDDFGHLQECFTGPGVVPPTDTCYDADLDRDFDVDQTDFGLLQVCLSGSGMVVDLSCAD